MCTKSERRYDIDYLRVFAILAVFVFHISRYFDSEGWHVKNMVTGEPFDTIIFILHKWIMPIFFVLAGAGAWYSLQSRSPARYMKERVYRLLIPLVFGIFTIIPHQVYIERITNGQYQGMSLLEFYPHYFDGFYAFGGNFAWMGLHLWFLLVLFIFTIFTLPLFLIFRKKSNSTSDEPTGISQLLLL
jgi:glucans biosynthesis protein C